MNTENTAKKIIKGRDLSRDEHAADVSRLLAELVSSVTARVQVAAANFIDEISGDDRRIEDKNALSLADTIDMTGLKQNEIYDMMRKREFPLNFKISGAKYGRKGWLKTEVIEWIKTQAPKDIGMQVDNFVDDNF